MKRLIFLIAIPLYCIAIEHTTTEKLTPYQIMKAVDDAPDGETRHSEMTMILTNKRGRTRKRTIVSYSKDYGKNTKKLMFFKKPADIRGTGFLSYEYNDSNREDDHWLYLPAMRKVRRISGSSKNDYFMGSDFTYDDMGDRDIDQYNYRLIKEEKCNNNQCWIIESIPKKGADQYYSKMIFSIQQDALKTVKCQYYDRDKRLLKTFTINKLKKHQGFWTTFEMKMENHQNNHQTTLKFKDISYNEKLSNTLFNVSTLRRKRIR